MASNYRFGAHMSVAGGLHLAAQRAHDAGCDVVQVFTKNNNQWNCKPLTGDDCTSWRQTLGELKIGSPIAHTSYLINLASADETLFQKSLAALVVEWQRCEQLGIGGLVMHPGAHTQSTAQEGLTRIVQGVRLASEQVAPQACKLLLENTAGQGTCLGWSVEQLGWLIERLDGAHVGVCWDTCHALAAGYDFRTPSGLKAMITELETYGVLPLIEAVHINDSKKDCGSRVDRHEHIGQGFIGEEGFRRFLRSDVFKTLPMYLETPKGTDEASGQDLDVMNLATLRRLASGRRSAATRPAHSATPPKP